MWYNERIVTKQKRKKKKKKQWQVFKYFSFKYFANTYIEYVQRHKDSQDIYEQRNYFDHVRWLNILSCSAFFTFCFFFCY